MIEIYLRMKEAVKDFETQAEHYKEHITIQLDKNKSIENDN